MNSAHQLQLRLFRGISGLEELRTQWNTLFASMRERHFFHTFDWYYCYLQHLEERPDDVVFCSVFDQHGALRAILPLQSATVRLHGLSVRQLRLPDHPHLPLRDVLLSPQDAENVSVRWLFDALRRHPDLRWDVIALERVLSNSSALSLFSTVRPPRSVIEHIGYCSYLPSADVDALFSKLSKNFRSNLARARNKLRENGNFITESIRDQPALEQAFNEFIEVEASGWKGEAGSMSAIKFHPELIGFYKCLLERFSARGDCEISLLKEGSRPCAVQFALRVDSRIYQLKIGYDENYSRMSPGNILIEQLLREYEQRNIQCLNLVSHTSWHKNWRAERHDLFSLYACNSTGVGVALYAGLRLKQILRPVYHATLKPLVHRTREL